MTCQGNGLVLKSLIQIDMAFFMDDKFLLFALGMSVVLVTCHVVVDVERVDAPSFVSALRYGSYLIV